MSLEFKNQADKYRNQISDALAKIGWRLCDAGCGYFRFINQNNEALPIVFFSDRIELDGDEFRGRFQVYFSMKDVEIDHYPDGKGIGFRGKTDRNIFLNCYNFGE